MVVGLAVPPAFEDGRRESRLGNNTGKEDYGWYAPIAILLAPLPANASRGYRNRISKPAYRLPPSHLSRRRPTEPWQQPQPLISPCNGHTC